MFPALESQRFWLKQIVPEDQAFIFKGLSNSQVIPYYGVWYETFEETKGQMEFYTREWEGGTGCHWKIVDKQTLLPAGVAGMNAYQAVHEKAEIGYWLLPEYWQKGIIQEVLPVIIRHLFANWKLHRLEAVIEEGNEASCRVTEKLGFICEGTLRESEMKKGKRISLMMYSLLRADLKINLKD